MRKLFSIAFTLALCLAPIRTDATVGLLQLASPSALDPATTAWISAVTSAGGAVSDAEQTRVNTLIVCYKTNSDWTPLDREWLLASENTQQSQIDIKSLASWTKHGTITFSANNGYTGDGTSGYLDTGFAPSTGGGNFVLNSSSIGVYVLTNRTVSNSSVPIGTAITNAYAYLQLLVTSDTFWEMNGGTFPNVPSTTSQGFWINTRTASNAIALDRNGSNIGNSTSPSESLSTHTFTIAAFNDTAGVDDWTTDQIAEAFIGGAMTPTQRNAKSACLNGYMTSLGINVY